MMRFKNYHSIIFMSFQENLLFLNQAESPPTDLNHYTPTAKGKNICHRNKTNTGTINNGNQASWTGSQNPNQQNYSIVSWNSVLTQFYQSNILRRCAKFEKMLKISQTSQIHI